MIRPAMFLSFTLALSLTWAVPSFAATCRSVGGHLEGRAVKATRTVRVAGTKIVLGGTFNGKRSPSRSIPCKRIARGYFCDREFDGVIVTVMTNGSRMIETLKGATTGQEIAGISYVCDMPL